MKPTILVFTRYYLPGYLAGGPIRTISNMVERLSDTFNFRVVAQDRDFGASGPYPGLDGGGWFKKGKALVRYVPAGRADFVKMAKIIRFTQHDAIYLNSFFDFRFTQLILINRMFGRLPDRPIILAPRGEFSEGALQFKPLKKKAFIRVAKSIGLYNRLIWQASSPLEAADIERTMSIKRTVGGRVIVTGHVAVAPDLADATGVADEDAVSVSARTRGRSEHQLRICFLSRISPKKNLDYALRVLSEVRVSVCFTIYGPIEDEAYWATCVPIIEGLPANIEVVQAGAISPDQILPALRQHELFLFPTHGENFGHVIHEALRAGLPLLISDQTPWQNLEQQGVGWALPLGNLNAFAERVHEVANWSEGQRKMSTEQTKRLAAAIGQDPTTLESNRNLFMDAIQGEQSRERAGK